LLFNLKFLSFTTNTWYSACQLHHFLSSWKCPEAISLNQLTPPRHSQTYFTAHGTRTKDSNVICCSLWSTRAYGLFTSCCKTYVQSLLLEPAPIWIKEIRSNRLTTEVYVWGPRTSEQYLSSHNLYIQPHHG